jgi:hypothetical protein
VSSRWSYAVLFLTFCGVGVPGSYTFIPCAVGIVEIFVCFRGFVVRVTRGVDCVRRVFLGVG